jgi:xylulose-5-phosphate/fructose-6-phosphate phosphoketolase
MIVLRTPKGWTGPDKVDGKQVEGTFRSHQVPLEGIGTKPGHLEILEKWMRSYKPEELFDREGRLIAELAALAPEGELRMGAVPATNGGAVMRDLVLPNFRDYAVKVEKPGTIVAESIGPLGKMLRDVIRKNAHNFRVVGPDETSSNRLSAVFEATNRVSTAEILPGDDHIAAEGRVMEILSEHMCQGWLEGYLLTGGTGSFRVTKRSSTSSIRCSTSMRNGLR